MQRFGLVCVAWILVLPLAGCEKAIPLQSSFWQAKDARIGVAVRTNGLQWQALMTLEDGLVPVEGEWDQPPAYPNLTNSLRKAADQAGQFLEREFFASSP